MTPPHIHIERLDLDARGLPPATVEAAMRALGPALQHALAQPAQRPLTSADQPLRTTSGVTGPDLAATIARHLASEISRVRAGA